MNIEYNRPLNCMQIHLEGTLSTQDILDTFDEMVKHPDFVEGSDALWDLCDASHPDLTVTDLYNIGSHVQKHAEKRGAGKTAWIVLNQVDFGIARMFEMLTDQDISIKFRVFDSVEEAKDWIKTGE